MSIPVDPITFDIVRHRLFRVVEEAILTLKHVSGSPITNEAHDLMVSLYTPDGGLLMGGVGFLHHMSCASAACKAIIRAAGRGIGAQAALGALIQGQEDIVVLPGVFAFSAVQKNIPVKLIAIYHPKTPVALITFPEKPARTPKDLVGMTVAHCVGETGTSYLDAFLKLNGVDPSKVKRTTINAQARVPAFIQRQVDVVSVYQTNDLPILMEQQETKFVIMDMVEFGLSIPGLSLATSDQNIAKRPTSSNAFSTLRMPAWPKPRRTPGAPQPACEKIGQIRRASTPCSSKSRRRSARSPCPLTTRSAGSTKRPSRIRCSYCTRWGKSIGSSLRAPILRMLC